MADKQKITELIYSAFDTINEELPKKNRLEKKNDEIIFGDGGKLDSLGLVNLIVSIESIIDEELDKQIVIANEKAMSMKNSPFRNVDTLAEFILELLNE
jgi:D-alanine--poly(phosphoribitol) ligase subunit 2